MSDQQKQEQKQVAKATTKSVVAIRRGYFGSAIHDPEGTPREREPFVVPADAKASWWVDAPKASKAQEADIG